MAEYHRDKSLWRTIFDPRHIFGVLMFMLGVLLVGFLVYNRWTRPQDIQAIVQTDASTGEAQQADQEPAILPTSTPNSASASTPTGATITPLASPPQPASSFDLSDEDALQLNLIEEYRLSELYPSEVNKTDENLGASGVVLQAGHFYVVFDNLIQLSRINQDLSRNSVDVPLLGRQVGDVDNPGELSFEDITYNEREQKYYILVEAVRDTDGILKAKVEEYSEQFLFLNSYWLPFWFEEANKGFEGIAYLHRDNQDYLLALCEGNDCRSSAEGRLPGNGRIQIFQWAGEEWVHTTTMNIPESVRFEDYAALDIQNERVAIVSQASQQLWVGTIAGSAWDFIDDGTAQDAIYAFPSDTQGAYCNVEGIAWILPDQLIAVSDQVQQNQAPECKVKEQSIHIFGLP